jgi:hypothetical protein
MIKKKTGEDDKIPEFRVYLKNPINLTYAAYETIFFFTLNFEGVSDSIMFSSLSISYLGQFFLLLFI